jgi:hypothetical protein
MCTEKIRSSAIMRYGGLGNRGYLRLSAHHLPKLLPDLTLYACAHPLVNLEHLFYNSVGGKCPIQMQNIMPLSLIPLSFNIISVFREVLVGTFVPLCSSKTNNRLFNFTELAGIRPLCTACTGIFVFYCFQKKCTNFGRMCRSTGILTRHQVLSRPLSRQRDLPSPQAEKISPTQPPANATGSANIHVKVSCQSPELHCAEYIYERQTWLLKGVCWFQV